MGLGRGEEIGRGRYLEEGLRRDSAGTVQSSVSARRRSGYVRILRLTTDFICQREKVSFASCMKVSFLLLDSVSVVTVYGIEDRFPSLVRITFSFLIFVFLFSASRPRLEGRRSGNKK